MTHTLPQHGDRACYLRGCQRPECRDGRNARRRAIRAGTLQPSRTLIDATEVREHILDLQAAGHSPTSIAVLAGVAHTTVLNFLQPNRASRRGRKRYTTPQTAAKILAVRPLTAAGTLRRVQALVAIGWTVRKIAAEAGVSVRWIVDLRPDSTIIRSHARMIADAYGRLRNLSPEKNGVWPGHAQRSRERARANRWPTPDYWDQHADDLDDPYFEPLYGVTRREIVAQDANWLMRSGLDRAAAAQRLGVSKSYLDHAFRDYPQYAYALEVAA